MRLCDPADAPELLRLAQRAAAERRRVIYFCSCNSPFASNQCHRNYLVREAVLEAAEAEGTNIQIQEWPGGTLQSGVRAERQVPSDVLKKERRGAASVPLGPALPPVDLLAWPHGSLLKLVAADGADVAVASVASARFTAGSWQMQLCAAVDPEASAEELVNAAARFREEHALEASAGVGPRQQRSWK